MSGYNDRNRIADYKATFSTEAGKRVLSDLAARHFMFAGTLHAEPVVMAAREGERNVVLGILEYLEMKPDDLPQIRKDVAEQFGMTEG